MAFYEKPKNHEGRNFACVVNFTKSPELEFDIYARGYKIAAETVVSSIINKGHFGDYEVYPALLLYRHSFELSLKSIVIIENILLCTKNNTSFNKPNLSHDLSTLLKNATDVLNLLFENNNYIIETIKEISIISNLIR
jgi:hypothetical protein